MKGFRSGKAQANPSAQKLDITFINTLPDKVRPGELPWPPRVQVVCRRENHDYSGLEAHIEYNIREGSRGASAGPVHTTSSFRMGGYRIIDLPDLSTDGPGEYFVRAVVTLKDAKGAELQTSENYTPNFRVVKDLANSESDEE